MAELLEIAALVDARGLSCPMPIVRAAQAIRVLPVGSVVEILSTDPGSQKDFVAWCLSTGHELVEQTASGPVLRFLIRRK